MDKTVLSRLRIAEAGIDTAVALFKLQRDHVGPFRGRADDLTWKFIPALSLYTVQGHPAPGELAADDCLDDFVERCAREIGSYNFVGFSRLDSTATIAFDRPSDGAALLTAAASVELPYVKPSTIGNPLETVYLLDKRGRGAKLGRIYDKGVESGTAEAGHLIRLESQQRYKSGRRPGLQHVPGGRSIYEKRFGPMANLENTVTVCGPPAALEQLETMFVAGELNAPQFDRLAGYVHRQGRNLPAHPKTTYRRKRELRDLGISMTDQHPDLPPIDLATIVDATIQTKEWR